jgi:hypothetical protein
VARPVQGGASGPLTAQWVYPAGHVHNAPDLVPAGTAVGERLPLWVDDAGRPVPSPRPTAAERTGSAAAGILAATAAIALGGGALARGILDRRDLRAWEREWNRVGPLWSGRPPAR